MTASSSLDMKQVQAMVREQWLSHFCSEEELQQLVYWLHSEGLDRPELFEERLEHSVYLRNLGNEQFKKSDYRRALHCALGAIHALDFTAKQQLDFTEEQRKQTAEALLPVLSNLTMILLKRGDFANAIKAAGCGLRCARKLPEDETTAARAKLLYRRGLARGEPGTARDLEGAKEDLADAARLDPFNHEIRTCLETCKELIRTSRAEKRDRAKSEQNDAAAKTAAVVKEEDKDDGTALCQECGPDGNTPVAKDDKELSPAAEAFARCLGRCLGRARRHSRLAQKHLGMCRSMGRIKLASALLLAPVVGLAMLRQSAEPVGLHGSLSYADMPPL